jgi:hypothetical protein
LGCTTNASNIGHRPRRTSMQGRSFHQGQAIKCHLRAAQKLSGPTRNSQKGLSIPADQVARVRGLFSLCLGVPGLGQEDCSTKDLMTLSSLLHGSHTNYLQGLTHSRTIWLSICRDLVRYIPRSLCWICQKWGGTCRSCLDIRTP